MMTVDAGSSRNSKAGVFLCVLMRACKLAMVMVVELVIAAVIVAVKVVCVVLALTVGVVPVVVVLRPEQSAERMQRQGRGATGARQRGSLPGVMLWRTREPTMSAWEAPMLLRRPSSPSVSSWASRLTCRTRAGRHGRLSEISTSSKSSNWSHGEKWFTRSVYVQNGKYAVGSADRTLYNRSLLEVYWVRSFCQTQAGRDPRAPTLRNHAGPCRF